MKYYFILILFLISITSASDWTPQGDINLRDVYSIKNGVNSTFDYYCNSTSCYTISDFLTGSGSGGLWTNSSGNATYTAGNVGIGTTSPSEKLNVNGSIKVEYSSTEYVTLTPEDKGVMTMYSTSSDTNDITNFLTLNRVGNVYNTVFMRNVNSGGGDEAWTGVNTYIDGEQMILGAFGSGFDGGATYGYLFPYIASRAAMVGFTSGLNIAAVDDIRFNTNILTGENERMRITSDGNVGIGTTTPTEKLNVNGSIGISENSSYLYDGENALRLEKGTETWYANTFLGQEAGTLGSSRQTALGYRAGSNNSAIRQSAFGYLAGRLNSGAYQTAIGYAAGYQNSVSSQNAIGSYAGYQNTGTYQNAIGSYAGYQNTGTYQNAMGYSAGYFNTGDGQNAIGTSAGLYNSGDDQTAIGTSAGYQNSANGQTAVGKQAGYGNSGVSETTIGVHSGYQNSGMYSTFIGNYGGSSNSGDYATGIGNNVLRNNEGNYTIGIGVNSLYDNTANNVVAIGYEAGKDNADSDQFIVKQANVNTIPLIQGNFSSGYVGIGTTSPGYPLEVSGNASGITAYFENNISAEDYLYHSPWSESTKEEALYNVLQISGENGELDHSSLPSYATSELKRPIYKKQTKEVKKTKDICEEVIIENKIKNNCTKVDYYENETSDVQIETRIEEQTSIGMLLSDLIKSVQLLFEDKETLANEITILRAENQIIKIELCNKDNSYSWCEKKNGK